MKENFKLIKEYEKYYLYGYEQDGKILYKECFLKVVVDGVEKFDKSKKRGNITTYKKLWGR